MASFTLTNRVTQTTGDWSKKRSGGGVWSESASAVVTNCFLAGNSASDSGGGACHGTLNNCIVYYNTARLSGDNQDGATLNYCCTTPLPSGGTGNLTNAPLWVNTNGWSNLRLGPDSPCINAGLNAYALGSSDLDSNRRIIGGTVDMGAYEYQGSGSRISYAWLQQYGLPTDGSADGGDPDADGHTTWQEWRCQTNPTNALSVLRLLSATPDGIAQGGVTVTWQSVAGLNYFLECSTNLSATPRFTPLVTNLPGQPVRTSFTHTNAANLAPLFYRVGAQQ